ncbi:MAG TPA: hypothetical protein PKE20_15785, partial [Promineifilum sp.]|nr:hypothetical protein [Promineifilum sp.]
EQAGEGWTQAGGLSLLIDIPTDGQTLVFSKAGGDAKLALAVRPEASISLGLGGLWFVGWLLFTVVVLMALRSAERRRQLLAWLPFAVCCLSALVVLVTPIPWSLLALTIFAITAGWVAWKNRSVAHNAA